MRIVFLAAYAPDLDADNAGAAFFAAHVERIARHHDVTVITPGIATRPPAGVRVVTVAAPVRPRWMSRLANVIRVVTPGPGVVDAVLADGSARAALAQGDVIEITWSQYLPFVTELRKRWPRTPVTAFLYDVLTQSLDRRRSTAPVLVRLAAMWGFRRARRLEPRLVNACDAVVVLAAKDGEQLRGLGVRVPIVITELVVPLPNSGRGEDHAAEPVVLFVGALWRWENSRGLDRFLQRSWLRVRAAVPTARLVVAGGGATGKLVAHGRHADGVEFTGFVDDLDPYYRAARVVVAPLWAGAGVKHKVAQAMAYGLPVVTTPVGAEGLVESDGIDAFAAVTGDDVELANATIRCLADPALAVDVGRRARSAAARRADGDAAIVGILDLYRHLTAGSS